MKMHLIPFFLITLFWGLQSDNAMADEDEKRLACHRAFGAGNYAFGKVGERYVCRELKTGKYLEVNYSPNDYPVEKPFDIEANEQEII